MLKCEFYSSALIDRKIPEFVASGVFVDNCGGAYHAIEHLIALGHHQIACVTHDGYISSVEDRIRGYEQAMRTAGLAPFAAVSIVRRQPTQEGQPRKSITCSVSARRSSIGRNWMLTSN